MAVFWPGWAVVEVEQAVEPAGEFWPETHEVQASLPAVEYFPAGQVTHMLEKVPVGR